MMLSGVQIEKLVETNEISVDPFDTANLKEVSYTFTLDERIKVLKSVPFIDARHDAEFEELIISVDGYLLPPGAFIISFTREHVKLNSKYACLLSNRSSLAQMGLNITLNSTFAEPNTDGKFALEIHNAGSNPIKLFAGMAITKGIFFEVG